MSAAPRVSWVALADTALASWEVRAPGQERALARAIIDAGECHRVFRIATIRRGGDDLEPFDYRAHLDAGAVPFALMPEEAPPDRRFVTPGRICWYEPNGTLAEGEIAQVGPLLRRLRPDALEWAEGFMAHVSPVTVWRIRDAIRLDLETDLWFPRILGFLDDRPVEATPRLRDNRGLAACHTPRLNAFLTDVRAAALTLGGTWRLLVAEGMGTNYAAMTTDRGINLGSIESSCEA